MTKLTRSVVVFCAVVTIATTAKSTIIQFDFSTLNGAYGGAGATNSPGHYVAATGGQYGVPSDQTTWNAIAPQTGAITGLNYADGTTATGVSLTLGRNLSNLYDGTLDWTVGAAVKQYQEAGSVPALYDTTLMRDYFYDSYTVGAKVAGLAAGTYRVYVLATEPAVTSRSWTLGIGVNPGNSQFGSTTTIGPAGAATTWMNGLNYYWKDVSISGPSDSIGVIMSFLGSDSPQLNGLQIVQVPEPSTILLFAVGGLFAWRSGRRKK